MKKRKWPTDLASARKEVAKKRAQLAPVLNLMETIASLDLYDQRPLFWRLGKLEWESTELKEVEASLVERAWRTIDDPPEMKTVKG
jgi:hypothetical protein